MRLRLALPVLALAPVLLLAYAPAPLHGGTDLEAAAIAAADTSHVNLQVFPQDIDHDRLIAAMQGFRRALGVRCDFCHVRGDDGEMDFPSDANPHKEIAREMMRMNRQLNLELLASIEGLHEAEGFRVTCWTCHRGEARPATHWPDDEESETPGGPPEHHDDEHHDGDHPHDDGHDG